MQQKALVDLGNTMQHVYPEPVLQTLFGAERGRRRGHARDDFTPLAQVIGVSAQGVDFILRHEAFDDQIPLFAEANVLIDTHRIRQGMASDSACH